jgi:hypothetical protein
MFMKRKVKMLRGATRWARSQLGLPSINKAGKVPPGARRQSGAAATRFSFAPFQPNACGNFVARKPSETGYTFVSEK